VLGVILAGMILSVSLASAEEYPSRPITLIVQFAAGTTTDIIARRVGEEVGKISDSQSYASISREEAEPSG